MSAFAPFASGPLAEHTTGLPELIGPAGQVNAGAKPNRYVRPSGTTSVTLTEVAVDGPLLVTVTMYWSGLSAFTDEGPVFTIDRSATGDTSTMTVGDLLFAASMSNTFFGCATVATFAICFSAGSMALTLMVNDADPWFAASGGPVYMHRIVTGVDWDAGLHLNPPSMLTRSYEPPLVVT